MNASKKNIGSTNGWILCPSKSFPGKFYYFNVLNGETAWSINDVDKKGLRRDSSIHKIADKSQDYPEPTSLPDDTSITSYNTVPKKPDFIRNIQCTQQLPTFGQAAFPKYVTNTDQIMPNIVWTPVQLPMPMFCPETKKPMSDKITQTSEFERELFIQTCDIPLCKRFQNYEKPFLSFDKRNKIVNKPSKFETSTPRNLVFENKLESQKNIPKSKPLIKEPVLKFNSMLPNQKIPDVTKNNGKPALSLSSKVESTESNMVVPKIVEKDKVFGDLDSTDLRFLLLAKRKKSVDTIDTAVERKKPKPNEIKHVTPKKVTFELNGEPDEDSAMSDMTTQEEFIPLTPHLKTTIDKPKTPTLHLKDITPICIKNTYQDTVKELTPYLKEASVPIKNNVWYIVVDTDVLLLDYELIDNLVLSDSKCRLVIPHAVRLDIEGLCIGDCRGQKRVINARQLTRKLVTPPPHYIVEPPPDDENSIIVTTESILNCCMKAINKNYYVVLITNDPHLQIKAISLNIRSFRLNEVKYGANIKPDMTSEHKKVNINIPNEDTDRENQFIKNKSNLSFFSNLNKSSLNTVKKQLFLNSDKDIDSSLEDCDKMINLTKPKCLKNDDSSNKYYDSDDSTTSDISREVQNLNLKDKTVLKPHNVNRNPFLPQNSKDGFVNLEKRIPNLNAVFSTYNFGKTISNTIRGPLVLENSVPHSNNDIHPFQNESSKTNFQNTKKLFCSIPISNVKQFQFHNPNSKTSSENSGMPVATKKSSMSILLRHEPTGASRESRILNPTQARIKKMFTTINCDSSTNIENDNQPTKTKDSTGVFKIPQPLQFKNRTRNTSAPVQSSSANDKIRTGIDIDCMDESLKRFCVKNKTMSEKISTRIDEWICSYIQIMEDVFNNLLQKSSVCMKDTVAPLTFHDTLNCIKMLYGSHTKIRETVDKLSELLDKCICMKGKLKTCIRPEDFMKMFGYGVQLVQALENILPLSEELKEAETCLSSLLTNIETNSKELDPELVKTPSVTRTEDGKDEEIRPNFIKEPSYVLDYLKKHFMGWASYKEELNDHNNTIHNHSDINVVRTIGKDLNFLKLDRSKTMSFTKNTVEDSANQNKDGPKIIKLLQNDQLNYQNNKEINTNTAGPKSIRLFDNDNNQNNFKNVANTNEMMTDQGRDVQNVVKSIKNIDQDTNNESKAIEEFFPNHGNTFMEKSKIDGPKMIRNIKLIDEYEKRIQNREPLDLDLLDYSEIYEPSVAENPEFDIISEKRNHSEESAKNNIFENNNDYGLTTMCVLEGFSDDVSLRNDNGFYASSPLNYAKNNNYTFNINKTTTKDSETISFENKISKNNEITNLFSINNNMIDPNNEKNTEKMNFGNESETYTEIISYNSIDNTDPVIVNSDTHIDNSETHTDNFDTHTDNSVSHTGFEKTAQIIRDDSTNDSGFENDSTYAHSVVKIFLNELSSSFKVIYQFVTKFVKEIREKELCEIRKNILHNQASKSLEDMVAIIERLRSIIKRESAEETVLKTLLLKAGVEATTDKRMTRYRQIVMKSLQQAQILENALKIIVSTTIGDFDALSTNAESINSSIKYFNIYE